MKKIAYSLLTLVVTAMGFASCENVPAPYDYPKDNKGGKTEVPGTYINETFTTGFGKFEVVTQAGIPWKIDFKTAKATGYDNKTKTNTPSESFLISPEINLSKSTGAYLQFEYIFQYAKNDGEDKVLITSDYTGDPKSTKWEDITGTLTQGKPKDWKTFYTFSKNIPASYIGKDKVRIAFYYSASAKGSRTWEVKNLKVKEGKISQQDPTPDNPTITPDAGESITIEAASMKFKDKEAATSFTHSDGTVITFDKGEGTDQPIYNGPRYTAVRLYAKNTMTIKAKKKITAIHIKTTDKYKEKLYNGNDEAYVLNGTSKVTIKKVNDTNVQFAPLNNSTIKLVNDFSTNKGGTQLRISSMTITFAKE